MLVTVVSSVSSVECLVIAAVLPDFLNTVTGFFRVIDVRNSRFYGEIAHRQKLPMRQNWILTETKSPAKPAAEDPIHRDLAALPRPRMKAPTPS